MYSKSLALSAVISALAAFGHSQMGLDLLPAFQSLSPPAAHSAQNAWWQVSGYFTLNGTPPSQWIGRTNRVAIQQARWAKYGITTSYDRILFWGLNALYLVAGAGYAMNGIVPPQIVFFGSSAAMLLSRLLA